MSGLPGAHAQPLILADEWQPSLPIEIEEGLLQLTGRWPLLLALVNARLCDDMAHGANVNYAAERAIEALRGAGPTALDITETKQRETATRATIEYSLKALGDDNRARFLELGVFPENTAIPIAMIELLWQGSASMGSAASRQLCNALSGLSLVTKYGSTKASRRSLCIV